MRAPRPPAKPTTPEPLAAVRIKAGEKLIPPHLCRTMLPEKELNGAIYRCTCDDYYRYFEHGLSYFYQYDTPDGNSHWARCDENGRTYMWTNVSPWWKKMWNIRDMRYIIPEEEDND